MNKVKVLLFDGSQGAPRLTTIDNTLDGFYKAIGCSTIEGYSNTMLGHRYGLDIYLDGEGKIKKEKPSLVGLFVREDTNEVVDTLVGNIIICQHDEEGEACDVMYGVQDLISRHIRKRSDTNVGDTWFDEYGGFQATDYLLVLYC